MGFFSVGFLALVEAFFIARPLDTKIITARVRVPHVDIGYIAILKQALELGFDDTIGNIPLRKHSPAARIGVESETARKHVHREAPILRISFAIVLVNENGTGQRKLFLSVKRIVGEKYPAFTADGKGFQALPAWPVTGGHFGVRGMTVAR
ncbi:MAG: hypothetical protein M3P26_02990 [Gemmatimonadota bacterium]|nr:hypothetical protein [Gemmatimonadota bacterium]